MGYMTKLFTTHLTHILEAYVVKPEYLGMRFILNAAAVNVKERWRRVVTVFEITKREQCQ